MSDPIPARDRPSMPDGYGIARGEEGMLDWDRTVERLVAARNYWVASARPDGRPHVAPVWGLWLDGAFYFSTDPSSRKGRNIAARPQVAVHLESGDDVVILEGTAERVADADTLARFAAAYTPKYGFTPDPSQPEQGVYRLRLWRAFAWREQEFLTTPTRWLFGKDEPGGP